MKPSWHGFSSIFQIKRSELLKAVFLRFPSWVTPNRVTCARIILAGPMALLLWIDDYAGGATLAAIAMSLDFVDGALAEACNQKSELGAFLDPLADKIVMCGALLAIKSRLPIPFPFAVWMIVGFAVALTFIRIVKWAKNMPVAATPDGKMKLIAEVATLALILGGLIFSDAAAIAIGGCLLFILPVFAAMSLTSQLSDFWIKVR